MLELSPRGKVEEGEDELTAAIREVREETGLLPHNLWVFEDLKRDVTYQECESVLHIAPSQNMELISLVTKLVSYSL